MAVPDRVLNAARAEAQQSGKQFDEAGFRAAAEADIRAHVVAGRPSTSIFNQPTRFEAEAFERTNPFLRDPQPEGPAAPDPIAEALNQLANIFKPPPPPPSPPAPVRQSVSPNTTSVERRRVDFGGFAAAATAPSGGEFSKRRTTLGAGL